MSEKFCHPRDVVSESLGLRGVVYNEMDLHGKVCTKRPMPSTTWWEIEGFHLTVGDSCRKLEGRQMVLRRNGDSHLVNVEFEDELQGCKKHHVERPYRSHDP